jgi:hypothetical protein
MNHDHNVAVVVVEKNLNVGKVVIRAGNGGDDNVSAVGYCIVVIDVVSLWF